MKSLELFRERVELHKQESMEVEQVVALEQMYAEVQHKLQLMKIQAQDEIRALLGEELYLQMVAIQSRWDQEGLDYVAETEMVEDALREVVLHMGKTFKGSQFQVQYIPESFTIADKAAVLEVAKRSAKLRAALKPTKPYTKIVHNRK